MKAPLPKATRRLLALGLGTVLALVVAELGYRLTRSSGLGPTTNPAYVTHDSQLGWSYKPGVEARHQSTEFDVAIRINAQGFRGADWPARSEDRKRVLVLGDSFAFGWGVEEDQTFAAVLAQLEPTWDVLNAGVSGYGTDQQLLLLRKTMQLAAPDLVICMFCPNDLFEAAGLVSYGHDKPRFRWEGDQLQLEGVPVPEPIGERISHLWRAVRKLLWEREHREQDRDLAEEWRRVWELYKQMGEDLDETPLLVISEQEQLRKFRWIEHLDLAPVLEPLGERAHFPLDGHLTAEGHAALGRALQVRAARLLGNESGAQ